MSEWAYVYLGYGLMFAGLAVYGFSLVRRVHRVNSQDHEWDSQSWT